jgi:3,4-dihydroxy 2-butanone 4-phosphate synthase/GTP cyclohydrolase II
MAIAPTQEIIDEIRRGRMVVLADAEDRENEGDLVLAADFVTPEAINFIATHARGLICLTLTRALPQLNLPLMVSDNRSPMGTHFTVSIEAATGSRPASPPPTARAPCAARPRSTPSPRTSCSPATSSRSWRRTAASSCAPATPRRAATCRARRLTPAAVICES